MEYYAIVVSERFSQEVLFNLFPIEDLEYYRDINIDNLDLEELSSKKNHYLEVAVDNLYSYLSFSKLSFSKNQWFQIDISDSNEKGNARFYENILSNEFSEVHINTVNFIDGRTTEGRNIRKALDLKKFVSDKTNASKMHDKIELELTKQEGKYFHLVVYNVGQGNCNALCDKDGKPQIYFDLGGGYAAHSVTYPPNLHLCDCDNPLIILSHWDGDHWKTIRKNPDFECMTWIVPEQTLTADAYKSFLAISKKGNLLIYPKIVSSISSNNLNLIKCTGRTKNDSGLALEVKIPTDDINRNLLALLPGDAKYKYISTTNDEFNYLVVTHHGGANPTVIPKPSSISDSNCHVYSYGNPNKYGHPKPDTINEHRLKGWNNRKNTEDGNIALGVQDLSTCNKHVLNLTNRCNAVISHFH